MTGRPQVAPTVLYDKQLDKSEFSCRLSRQEYFPFSVFHFSFAIAYLTVNSEFFFNKSEVMTCNFSAYVVT